MSEAFWFADKIANEVTGTVILIRSHFILNFFSEYGISVVSGDMIGIWKYLISQSSLILSGSAYAILRSDLTSVLTDWSSVIQIMYLLDLLLLGSCFHWHSTQTIQFILAIKSRPKLRGVGDVLFVVFMLPFPSNVMITSLLLCWAAGRNQTITFVIWPATVQVTPISFAGKSSGSQNRSVNIKGR